MRHILVFAIGLLLAATSLAQSTAAMINKALDEQVKLSLNSTLPDAMAEIRKDTGVRLQAAPMVWDLLPWGRETNVTAKIENVTLREALTLITRKLGLVMVLRDEYVELQPMPALLRIGQRASIQELRALDFLASTQLGLQTDRPTVRQLLESVDLKLAPVKDPELAIENRIGDAIDPAKTVFVPRNATMMAALESLPKETKVTWYPWGTNILIVTKQDRTRALLEKPLTIRMDENGKDVLQVLMEVSQQTGVPFEYQPGAAQAIPADARTIRGVIADAPAQQILGRISASTGLAWAIQDDRVYISAPANAATAAGPRDRSIGMIQLDNGMQALVPTSQVPPDVREYIRYKIEKEIKKIRQQMIDEGFKPTTQPAATPEPDRDL